jgi:polygalacturonase
MRRLLLVATALTAAVTAAVPVAAQDRRTVVEPRLPASACATLAPAAGNRATDIQAALKRCAGQAVRLSAGRHDSGPLEVPAKTILWLDKGAVLAAIPDPALFDDGSKACGTINQRGKACRPLLHIADATDVAIVGDGTIEGNGGKPMAGGTETWWQLARRAQVEKGSQNVPRLIVADRGSNFVLYRVRLANSPNFHVVANRLQGFTAWGVIIDTPADARNTDGIDPGASDDVTITKTFIRTGDDNVAIKAGKTGGTHYVSIFDNHFYSGHGMSIGSETNGGVAHILVKDLTLDGTTSGLRIKSDVSRGGQVADVHYENVCIRGSKRPIDIYTAYDKDARGDLIPQYRDIVFRHVHGDTGQLIANGYDPAHVLDLYLDDVRFAPGTKWESINARFHIGTGGASPDPTAATSVASAGPTASEDRCKSAFVGFPERG